MRQDNFVSITVRSMGMGAEPPPPPRCRYRFSLGFQLLSMTFADFRLKAKKFCSKVGCNSIRIFRDAAFIPRRLEVELHWRFLRCTHFLKSLEIQFLMVRVLRYICVCLFCSLQPSCALALHAFCSSRCCYRFSHMECNEDRKDVNKRSSKRR